MDLYVRVERDVARQFLKHECRKGKIDKIELDLYSEDGIVAYGRRCWGCWYELVNQTKDANIQNFRFMCGRKELRKACKEIDKACKGHNDDTYVYVCGDHMEAGNARRFSRMVKRFLKWSKKEGTWDGVAIVENSF